jgi:hypothetical protein
VLIHVNGLEITQAGAGRGMHPFDLFVPANRLVATTGPQRVIVARGSGRRTRWCGWCSKALTASSSPPRV